LERRGPPPCPRRVVIGLTTRGHGLRALSTLTYWGDMETETREDQLRRIPFQRADPTKWPKGVRVIGVGEVEGMGVDADGRLYWHGKPVEIIGQRLELTFWQKVWAIILAVGAFSAFVVTLLEGSTVLIDWMCKVGWIVTSTVCSPP
jgi:hypothetical protein